MIKRHSRGQPPEVTCVPVSSFFFSFRPTCMIISISKRKINFKKSSNGSAVERLWRQKRHTHARSRSHRPNWIFGLKKYFIINSQSEHSIQVTWFSKIPKISNERPQSRDWRDGRHLLSCAPPFVEDVKLMKLLWLMPPCQCDLVPPVRRLLKVHQFNDRMEMNENNF